MNLAFVAAVFAAALAFFFVWGCLIDWGMHSGYFGIALACVFGPPIFVFLLVGYISELIK